MSDIGSNPQEQGASQEKTGFVRALGLFPATAINMSQMVGIGPFITIPLMLTAMAGPQALLGWILGALLAISDGQVWAELGAAMPSSGGSYVYLREAFQYWLGKLMPFLFVWTILLATAFTMSTGMIGMAQYLQYIWPSITSWEINGLAVVFTIITVALLYRRIESIATITKFLWGCMILTVLVVIISGLTRFNPQMAFTIPAGAFTLGPQFFTGLGAGLIVAIYDYLGYFSTAYLGDEIARPGRNIPLSIMISIAAVGAIYLIMNVVVLGVVPLKEAQSSTAIGSLLIEIVWGRGVAIVVTLLIVVTGFASVYTGLLAGSRLPYNASRDGLFFRVFGRLHSKLNFPHIALLVTGAVTAIGCLFNLSFVISVLVAASVIVQFIGQVVALTILRIKQPNLRRPYKQWLYPLFSIIALLGWAYVFWASGLNGGQFILPLWLNPMIVAIGWAVLGVIAYLIWAFFEHSWPFARQEVREPYVSSEPAD